MSDNTIQSPSHNHPNRKSHNWLAYKTLDELLVRHASSIAGTVYDLGCGEQAYRGWLLDHADEYIGVDWENSLHDHRARIIADLNHPIPVPDAAADTVFSISVLEHLKHPDTYLREAYRILKPGCALVLQVPFMWRVHEAPHDYQRFTSYGLEALLQSAGFEHIQIIPQTGFWGMWVLNLNYHLRRYIKGPAPVRFVLKVVLRLIWMIDQSIAYRLDRIVPAPEETGAYFVLARKP